MEKAKKTPFLIRAPRLAAAVTSPLFTVPALFCDVRLYVVSLVLYRPFF